MISIAETEFLCLQTVGNRLHRETVCSNSVDECSVERKAVIGKLEEASDHFFAVVL